MSNITPIEIFPGINNLPTPPSSSQGCNGSFLVQRVNDLIRNQNKPTTNWDDSSAAINFWIDTVNGDDANDGLTQATPKQSWEGLLPILRTKTFTDNWNTYVNIKGEFQGEKDFSELYAWDRGYQALGYIYLQGWDGEPNWVWRSAVEGPEDYLPKSLIKAGFYTPGINIDDCDFIIETLINFSQLYLYLDSSSKFIIGSEANTTALTFTDCYIDSRLSRLDLSQLSNSYSVIRFVNTFVYNLAFADLTVGTNTQLEFNLHNSVTSIFNNVHNVANYKVNLSLDASRVYASEKTLLSRLQIPEGVKIQFPNNLQYLGESLSFPTLANGRYKVWMPPRPCFLKKWVMSASAGTGTFQMDANGSPWGDPITTTFTPNGNFFPTISRNLDFDIQNEDGFHFYLNVSNASGLTNVLLQFRYTEW